MFTSQGRSAHADGKVAKRKAFAAYFDRDVHICLIQVHEIGGIPQVMISFVYSIPE